MVNVFCVILCIIALDQVISSEDYVNPIGRSSRKIGSRKMDRAREYGMEREGKSEKDFRMRNKMRNELENANSYSRPDTKNFYGLNHGNHKDLHHESSYSRPYQENFYRFNHDNHKDSYFENDDDSFQYFLNHYNTYNDKHSNSDTSHYGPKPNRPSTTRIETTPQPSKCFLNLNSEYELLIIFALIALNIPLSYCLYLSYQHYLTIKEIQRKRSQNTVKAMANSNKPFNVFLI